MRWSRLEASCRSAQRRAARYCAARILLVAVFAAGGSAKAQELKVVHIRTSSPVNQEVEFAYRVPRSSAARANRMLLLVPGFNGAGREWLAGENAWTRFADEQQILLVGPSFRTTPEEAHAGRGYYYPALWSGRATFEALEEIARRERVTPGKVLLFGFSAGAHFVHRFAVWKPERVQAFVAYSAAWWDAPTPALRGVPGLVMCGEADERLNASMAFVQQGLRQRLPLVWRAYAGTGHEITQPVMHLAQAFLREQLKRGAPAEDRYVGDIQSYQYFAAGSPEAMSIPEELGVELPSRQFAELWSREE